MSFVMPPRPDGIINVTLEEVADARLATEDIPLVRPDGTLTPAGMLYVADSRRAIAEAPLDVWLLIPPCEHDDSPMPCDCDDEASHEANTYRQSDGTYRVDYYHTAVGQISSRRFHTYNEAREWLESEGFQDFSS